MRRAVFGVPHSSTSALQHRCTGRQHFSTAALQHWIEFVSSANSPHHRLLVRHRRGDRVADDAGGLDGVRDRTAS
jgi:hypothetical protein